MRDLAPDELGHEVRAERELKRAGASGLKRVMAVGLAAFHLHRRSQRQFARSAILQLVETNVDVGQVEGLPTAVFEVLHRTQADVLERDILQLEPERFRRFGRRCRRRLFLLLEQRVEVTGAVGVLNDLDRRRVERDFVHLDVAAEDAPQTVTEPDFVRLKKRLGAGGSDLEPAQDDL